MLRLYAQARALASGCLRLPVVIPDTMPRNTGGVGAPTIMAFTPNTGNAGASVNISLTGTNLTGASLATNNPGILVRNVLTTPTSITATFQIAHPPR